MCKHTLIEQDYSPHFVL